MSVERLWISTCPSLEAPSARPHSLKMVLHLECYVCHPFSGGFLRPHSLCMDCCVPICGLRGDVQLDPLYTLPLNPNSSFLSFKELLLPLLLPFSFPNLPTSIQTGDCIADWNVLEKAVDLADRLLPSFRSKSGIPFTYVNLKTGAVSNNDWAPSRSPLTDHTLNADRSG